MRLTPPLKTLGAALALALLLGLAAPRPALAEEGWGTITVYNNSDHEVYIVIGGYNQGRIWKHSSEDYEFRLGEHKVEAWVGDFSAKDWVTLTRGYPSDSVTFDNDDFPEVKPNR